VKRDGGVRHQFTSHSSANTLHELFGQTTYDTDCEAGLKSVNWYLQGTHAGETDTKHGLVVKLGFILVNL